MSENRNQEELKAILKKYTSNEATPVERDAVDWWYRTIGSESNEVPLLDDIKSKAQLKKSISNYLMLELTGRRKHWFRSGYVRYAAAGILLIGLGLIGYEYQTRHRKLNDKEIVIISGRGAQKLLVLTDGSEVLLNVDSKLIIAKDFGDSTRRVQLTGEAFFKVAKDETKPFIIQSGDLKTKVLGTSFNINAYPDLEKIKIAVMTGRVKVSISKPGTDKLLTAGMVKNQTLSFYRENQDYEVKTEDSELISSWRTNKLYIDNANMEEIARHLERYYHIKVVYTGKANLKDKYTIRFNNESMNGVLQILSALTKRKFSYENQQITIK